MKTEIIIQIGWRKIAGYDYLMTMSKGDVVYFEGHEYIVDCCLLEIEKSNMVILVKIN